VISGDESIQAVSSTEDTVWRWHVKAKDAGLHTLTVRLVGTLNVEGEQVTRNFYELSTTQVAVDLPGLF